MPWSSGCGRWAARPSCRHGRAPGPRCASGCRFPWRWFPRCWWTLPGSATPCPSPSWRRRPGSSRETPSPSPIAAGAWPVSTSVAGVPTRPGGPASFSTWAAAPGRWSWIHCWGGKTSWWGPWTRPGGLPRGSTAPPFSRMACRRCWWTPPRWSRRRLHGGPDRPQHGGARRAAGGGQHRRRPRGDGAVPDDQPHHHDQRAGGQHPPPRGGRRAPRPPGDGGRGRRHARHGRPHRPDDGDRAGGSRPHPVRPAAAPAAGDHRRLRRHGGIVPQGDRQHPHVGLPHGPERLPRDDARALGARAGHRLRRRHPDLGLAELRPRPGHRVLRGHRLPRRGGAGTAARRVRPAAGHRFPRGDLRGDPVELTMATAVPSARDLAVLRSLARRIDPSDPGAHNNLGVLYYERGLFPEAVAAFARALELDPRMAVAQENRERVQEETGHYDRLIADLRERLRRQPHDEDARLALGKAYVVLGQFDRAVEEFEAL